MNDSSAEIEPRCELCRRSYGEEPARAPFSARTFLASMKERGHESGKNLMAR